MKTLLVTFQNNMDVIGLKYLHAYLRKNAVDSQILFIPKYKKEDFKSIESFLDAQEPKVIGISLMSSELDCAKEFSLAVKKRFPNTLIVWGGIHPSVDPKGSLNYCDYILIGESERSYLEFITARSNNNPVNGILNLGYKSRKGYQINKLRPVNKNLDGLPFPGHFPKNSFILHNRRIVKLNKSIFKKYARYSGRYYNLMASRGCNFSCTFCINSFFSKLYGKSCIRRRSVDNVIEELKQAVKGFPEIAFIDIEDDDFFCFDTGWIKDFAKRYKKEVNKKFVCRANPLSINEEKALILKDAGLFWVLIGLQTGSEKANKEVYKRYISNKRFLECAKIVNKCGLTGQYDVILDNPFETEEDLLETIDIILKIPKPFMLSLSSLCFYQGTDIYNTAIKKNLKVEDPTKKSHLGYKLTLLNKVVRMSPFLPKNIIRYLINNRKSSLAKMFVSLTYFPVIVFIESAVSAWLIFKSFDKSMIDRVSMLFSFVKTAINRVVLRKTV